MSRMKDFLEEVRVMVLHGASVERIAAHLDTTEAQVEGAIEILMDDPDFRDMGDFDEPEPLSAEDDGYIYGTDEDYGSDFHDGEYV